MMSEHHLYFPPPRESQPRPQPGQRRGIGVAVAVLVIIGILGVVMMVVGIGLWLAIPPPDWFMRLTIIAIAGAMLVGVAGIGGVVAGVQWARGRDARAPALWIAGIGCALVLTYGLVMNASITA